MSLVNFEKTSGSIHFIEEDCSCIAILDRFVGTFESISESCIYLTIIVKSDSQINSNISLNSRQNKLDVLAIKGPGSLNAGSLKATSIEIKANLVATSIEANVVKISECKIIGYLDSTQTDVPESFIQAIGHVSIFDTHIINRGYDYSISSPYILIDNSHCEMQANVTALQTSNAVSVIHCLAIDYTQKRFYSNAVVLDESGEPKSFTYAILRNSDGTVTDLVSRRKLYGYNVESTSYIHNKELVSSNQSIPAQPATPYDFFKHSTQFTNVDLHRWINQHGEIFKGLGTNYIPQNVIELICNDLWFEESSEWEAIPDEIIDLICTNIYSSVAHIHSKPEYDCRDGSLRFNLEWDVDDTDTSIFSIASAYIIYDDSEYVDIEDDKIEIEVVSSSLDKQVVQYNIDLSEISVHIHEPWVELNVYISYQGQEFLPSTVSGYYVNELVGTYEYSEVKYFPKTGEVGIRYIDKSTNATYQWDQVHKKYIEASELNEFIIPVEFLHLYDHPHTSIPMTQGVIDSIIEESYIWPRENGYELDELDSRKFEVGIYSLNSYRTTESTFYDADIPLNDDRELP